MECKYNHNEFCTNADCPMRGDYCSVSDIEGVCRHEDREEERYILTPKSCLMAVLVDSGVNLDDETIDDVWSIFQELMTKSGYVEECD